MLTDFGTAREAGAIPSTCAGAPRPRHPRRNRGYEEIEILGSIPTLEPSTGTSSAVVKPAVESALQPGGTETSPPTHRNATETDAARVLHSTVTVSHSSSGSSPAALLSSTDMSVLKTVTSQRVTSSNVMVQETSRLTRAAVALAR